MFVYGLQSVWGGECLELLERCKNLLWMMWNYDPTPKKTELHENSAMVVECK